MDLSFNEAYGTEMPTYRFEYQLSNGGTTISGNITQSGVSDKFKMIVPIYGDYGKGFIKLGSATLIGYASVALKDVKLPSAAKRAAACAADDVLALHIQNEIGKAF